MSELAPEGGAEVVGLVGPEVGVAGVEAFDVAGGEPECELKLDLAGSLSRGRAGMVSIWSARAGCSRD